jgi:flavin reductase (DIM6/NTAB) family NADH-FMN oxidoreductase RutF
LSLSGLRFRYRYGCVARMMEVPLSVSVWLLSPRVTVLVNTLDEKGELNSSPYSFVFPLGVKPPLVGVGVGEKHKLTYINAKRTGEFVLCVVSEDFGQRAINCEAPHNSGNKLWEKEGFHVERSKSMNVPRIREGNLGMQGQSDSGVERRPSHPHR